MGVQESKSAVIVGALGPPIALNYICNICILFNI